MTVANAATPRPTPSTSTRSRSGRRCPRTELRHRGEADDPATADLAGSGARPGRVVPWPNRRCPAMVHRGAGRGRASTIHHRATHGLDRPGGVCRTLGRPRIARAAARAMADLQPDHGFLWPERRLGAAWAAFAVDDQDTAVAKLIAGADEAELLYEAARFGAHEQVARRLTALAGQVDGPLMAARVAFTQGAATHDHTRLANAETLFADVGAHLAAAEARPSSPVSCRRRGALAIRAQRRHGRRSTGRALSP